MNPGDIVLTPMPQVGGGSPKLRPAGLLAELPGPYQTMLLCGISTKLHKVIPAWDEVIQPGDPDFPSSGLHKPSVIRRNYLSAVKPEEVAGVIGSIAPDRLTRLRTRLADRVRP
jgi:mRNA interferase MazF